MRKPILALTLGDPSGIGPEVVLKALLDKKVRDRCCPLVVGDAQVLAAQDSSLKIRPVLNPAQARFRPGVVDVLHLPSPLLGHVVPGKPDAFTGALSARAVEKSVELALTRLVDGIVHAPISKHAWKQAGVRDPGHTEMIARLCGVKKVAMAIAAEPLRTVMVTRHIPLSRVPSALRSGEIVEAVEFAFGWMRRLKISKPRIGVCALNPHAGEKGLIGTEEIRIVGPAVLRARKAFGASVEGPLPADSAYRAHRDGRYDCLVTLYHDQSLIPLKLFAGERLVNITLGLPFPRTSPGHGTAFDIAGRRRADPRAMIEAVLTAARLCGSPA